MRVAFFHSGTDLYGASRSLMRLTRALLRDGHEIQVIVREAGPLVTALQRDGIPVVVEPGLRCLHRSELASRKIVPFLLGIPWAAWKCRRILREFRADLVHSNTGTVLSGSMAAWLAGVPHVWHIRDMFDEFGILWRAYGRWILRRSRRVICVSRAVADQFRGMGGASSKVTVIHNGFPPEEFTPPDPAARRDLRAKWGMGETVCAIGILGRIKLGRKGQEVLVRAVGLLHASRFTSHGDPSVPPFKLVIVGAAFPGNEEHEVRLRALVRELGLEEQVIFAGEFEDPRPVYAALDVVVLASARPEPFGGVVIEAMAMGRPVVGTALGGTVEQIEEKVTGFLIPPDDPAAMAGALEKLIGDSLLRERMGRAGRQRFEERFTFDQMYARILKCYREAVAES